MFRATLLATAVAFAPSTSTAQGHPLIGAWSITFPAGMRIENGTPTPITRTGKFTVVAQGDSLIATLATDPADGLPPRPDARLATKAGPGDVVFIHRSTARININGNEREATSISTWTLSVMGDKLEGTVTRQVEGMDAPSAGPQPVTGTRVGS
ncbi:MAG: hypothetical protein ACKVZ0_15355 [Gemmatimonadales bacterium]